MTLTAITVPTPMGHVAIVYDRDGIERHRTDPHASRLPHIAQERAEEAAQLWIEEHNRNRQEQPQ